MEVKARISNIDFVRGVAIISVILLHTLSANALKLSYASLHIGQAVPIFLFITLYLSFKGLDERGGSVMSYFRKQRIGRLCKQVFLPFLIVVVLQAFVRVICGYKALSISDLVAGGGRGPGSYYFWVYLQIWILVPFLFLLFKKTEEWGFLILLIICLILNYGCVCIGNEGLYRLSCIRYLFLAVPAYMYLRKESFNVFLLSLCVLGSLLYLVFLQKIDLSPFILNFGWSSQQWPAYFWTFAVFVFLMWLGSWLQPANRIYALLCWLGRNSWYVFLAQMFLLCYLKEEMLTIVDIAIVNKLIFISLTMVISVLPALLIEVIKGKLIKKH